jgi:hypothetical protein
VDNINDLTECCKVLPPPVSSFVSADEFWPRSLRLSFGGDLRAVAAPVGVLESEYLSEHDDSTSSTSSRSDLIHSSIQVKWG